MLEDGFEHVPGVPVEVVATVGQDDALGCVSLQLEQVRLQALRAVVELVSRTRYTVRISQKIITESDQSGSSNTGRPPKECFSDEGGGLIGYQHSYSDTNENI